MMLTAALLILLGTWAGFTTVAPVAVGFWMGLTRPGRAARMSALGGLVAWSALLFVRPEVSSIAGVSGRLGNAMGLPGWLPIVLTLTYPVILAASAAWIGQLFSNRRNPLAA